SIREVAELSRRIFHIDKQPTFNMPQRSWDVEEWFADTSKTKEILGWHAKTELSTGIRLTVEWFENLENKEQYLKSSKKNISTTSRSISAIIACYKDGQAIPIMYKRLTDTFLKLGIDYEIIFVNDNSPDDSENIILQLSKADPHVIGISHSRNFGSQAAFKSGMEIATKDACVLLDGDLQDPPELITEFYDLWIEGYDVVFGRRIKREAPLGMQLAYKLFYRVFDYFSYIAVPRDAGDFSLIDKRVMQRMLSFPERDLFLRGVRAFAGFKQIGVDYIRPERMFGESTNNLIKNIGWAKKGILSFTNTPLNILSFIGMLMFVLSVLLGIVQILSKFLWPTLAPKGITTIMLIILFFGSINLLAIGLVGEYIAKILEEVKQRPHFIRRNFIVNGELRDAYIGREWFN
ncbi:MAG: glycosyltransferase, partial [Clostridiales bacterium]|nr:glycosyltransferase [Clostridiales bacterium]